ncbi:MAG: ferrochelatase [Dysgonamonadaceae bacterium]
MKGKAILILNTGSPKSDQPGDVKQFIGDMLSDPKLLDLPNPFRYMLARWIIAPKRQYDSAHHYQLIWDYQNQSSPLVYHVRNLCRKLEEKTGVPVEHAFRYGHPNAEDAIKKLEERVPEMEELIVMHLFPHFAQSSYQTTIDEVTKYYKKKKRAYHLRLIQPYYNHPEFIKALSQQVKPFVEKPYDKLLFSYHSLPLKHIEREKGKGKEFDYVFQTEETLRLVSEQLGLDKSKNRVAYSSAISKNWQKPFLDDVIEQMPANGDKNIVVVCAGFPTDNLESLFDIDVQAKEIFRKQGGEELRFVPGLNSEDFWVDAVWKIINNQ